MDLQDRNLSAMREREEDISGSQLGREMVQDSTEHDTTAEKKLDGILNITSGDRACVEHSPNKQVRARFPSENPLLAIPEIASKMGLKFLFNLSTDFPSLGGELVDLKRFLCNTIGNTVTKDGHLPIDGRVSESTPQGSLDRVSQNLSLNQPFSTDHTSETSGNSYNTEAKLKQTQPHPMTENRTSWFKLNYGHHSVCNCQWCPKERSGFRLLSSEMTFIEHRRRVHQQFDTEAASKFGIDLLEPMREGYSVRAKTFLEELMKHYYEMLHDDDDMELDNDLSTSVPTMRLPNPNRGKAMSMSPRVKDDKLLGHNFNEEFKEFATIVNNLMMLSTTPAQPSRSWLISLFYGAWSVMLTLIAADFHKPRLYENIQSALTFAPRDFSNYIIEQIVSLALRDASSQPWQFQETMDLTLFEATRHHIDYLIDLSLLLGANAFTTVKDGASAFDIAVSHWKKEYSEKFIATAWNKRLISNAKCQEFSKALGKKEFDVSRQDNDDICTSLRNSIAEEVKPGVLYFLTNIHDPRYSVDDDFWIKYSRKHGISMPSNIEKGLPDLGALQAQMVELRHEKQGGIDEAWLVARSQGVFTWLGSGSLTYSGDYATESDPSQARDR